MRQKELEIKCGPKPTTLAERLKHTMDLYTSVQDDELAIMATSHVYGPGERTGIT